MKTMCTLINAALRPALCLVVLCAVCTVEAQSYPFKPVRVIIPWPPGGANDIAGRIVMQKVGEALGQQFPIDNRGGAGGTIGTDLLAKAPADGYTIGVISGSHTINPALYRKLPFDSARDFAPVTKLVSGPGVLVIHPSIPANSVKELIAFAKAHPGQLTAGSSGNGTASHLAIELLNMMGGIKTTHIPYKGLAPAHTDRKSVV